MIPSPFHGIFSSSIRSDAPGDATALPVEQASVSSTSPSSHQTFGQSKKHAPASKQSGMGQVALDIFEYEDYYILKAPIAGVRLSDLDIEVNDNILTIRGNRRQNDAVPDEQYYLKECFWGEFQRSVTLPCSIDSRKVKATFNKDSILKIFVPKTEDKVKITRISE